MGIRGGSEVKKEKFVRKKTTHWKKKEGNEDFPREKLSKEDFQKLVKLRRNLLNLRRLKYNNIREFEKLNLLLESDFMCKMESRLFS